ncbi:MAG: hypothetical protein MJ192_02255 [Clostridia bacterium]|nr:hypothetical protein [Clostridia bacterium]
MKIIRYDEIYRDDMIFMVLQAKDALGRKPTINTDLLDIQANYLDRKEQWFESYAFYPKHGYTEYKPRYMMKVL